MKFRSLLFLFLMASAFTFSSFSKKEGFYELRIYHCEPGKLPDLEQRFRNHTRALFEKHGMTNVAYWTPTKEGNQSLYYILKYKDRADRDRAWKNFIADPEWQAVQKKSEENGKIVAKVESVFLKVNKDLSKETSKLQAMLSSDLTYEMRTYYMFPGKFQNIVDRFKNHTRKLFEKQGMKNVVYFTTVEEKGVQPKLLYFLMHQSEEAATKSWNGFRNDPEWAKVRDASEVSGKIVEKVESIYLKKMK